MKPLCFILMPFGIKKDENGKDIDFDKIYDNFIKPAIKDAGLEVIRADEEQIGGIIHKPMYERLMLCEYAVADLSTANANVFYELGIRHAIRPHSTISIFEDKSRLPFDISYLRSLPYDRELSRLKQLKKELTKKLLNAKKLKDIDSPLFQLVDGIKPSNIEHIKTDIFRKQVKYNTKIKNKLSIARDKKSKKSLSKIEKELGNLKDIESGVLIDLFLSYRAVEAFDSMIELVYKMPTPLSQTIMIQEQLGFALNRVGKKNKAIEVLESIIEHHGKSSETCGILGRVYKDYWQENISNKSKSKGYLKKAIDIYLDGFEADFRDPYPGINALTLMDIADDNRFNEIYPVVLYAVKQKMKDSCDYWDYATLLELYVLKKDKSNANDILSEVVVHIREPWEAKTTINNLTMIKNRCEQKGEKIGWIEEIIKQLKSYTILQRFQ